MNDLIKAQEKLLQTLKSLDTRVRKLEAAGASDHTEALLHKQQELLHTLQGLLIRVERLEGGEGVREQKEEDEEKKSAHEEKEFKGAQDNKSSGGDDDDLPAVVYQYLGKQPKLAPHHYADLMRNDTDVTIRLRNLCFELGFKTWKFKRVPKDYYDWEYEARRAVLGAPSIDYLCKSVIMENSKCSHDDYDDRTNSKYYLIVLQYVAKLHKESMAKVVQGLNPSGLGKKNFNFRFAPEDVNDRLSGFEHNAVTPLGMKEPIPIILDQAIADKLEFIWLGGGEVDVKWGVPIKEFIRIFNPIIGSVSK